MRGPVRRLATAAVAASAFCALAMVSGGCEKLGLTEGPAARADRRAEATFQDLEKATGASATPDAVRKALERAAGESGASAAMKVHSKSRLAEAELDAANSLIDDIDRAEVAIARTAWEIGDLTSRIQTGNAMAAAYARLDPAPRRRELAQKIAEVQGGPGKATWVAADGVAMPTIAALQQQIARLQEGIAKQDQRIKTLGAERGKLLEDAEQATRRSLGEKGLQSVTDYNNGATLRKQAADRSVEADRCAAAIVPLQRDLAVAQAQLQVLNEAVAQYQQQDQALVAGWAQIQKQIEAQGTLSKAILGGGSAAAGKGADSISAKAALLADGVKKVQQDRELAAIHLRNAISHFGEAHAAATEVGRSLKNPAQQGRPEQDATKRLAEIYNSLNYTLQKAVAQRTLATLMASQAQSLATRLQLSRTLAPVLAAAKLPMPEELKEGNLPKDLATARQLTNEEYGKADELLKSVIEAPAQTAGAERVLAGRIARIFTLYGWSQALSLAGDAKRANTQLQLAVQERDMALSSKAVLPPLPAALAPAPARAAATATPKAQVEKAPGGK